jgi:O-antigen/teichoic acid export membrane protein
MESERTGENIDRMSRRKVIDALAWSFVETVVMRGIQFTVGIVLARLLFPEQFGLIGMLLIFTSVARTLMEGGFGAALIQKLEATQTDICSLFYFNIFVGLLTAGAMCLAAPWIADFYGRPILVPLARVLSLTVIFSSLGMVQNNLLYKEINFKAQTIASLVAGLLSGVVGIGLAIGGFGVWSLALQQVTAYFAGTVCLWALSSWRPSLTFRIESLRKMFGFGSRLLLSELLNQVFDNIYIVAIGKLFSASDLGLFTRAKNLEDMPSQTLSLVVERVAFPVFSSYQDDPARLKKGLKKALTVMALLNFPLMIGLALTARPLVLVLLGWKWAGCIGYLQLLCGLGLIYPLYNMNLNVLKSMGRSDMFLRLQIIWRALSIVNLVLTWHWGISAMIGGMVVSTVLAFLLSGHFTNTLIYYPLREQLRDLIPYLAVAALMGATVFCIGLLKFPSSILLLITQVTAGPATYFGLCWALRLAAFVEARNEVRQRIPFLGATASR